MSEYRRLKSVHPVIYNGLIKRRQVSGLALYANVDDVTLKKAPADTLEGMANQLLHKAEQKEQAEARRQAKRYDRSYVEKADYSITSLYSDFKTDIEDGRKTWADYKQERKKWRRCKYKHCLNVFTICKDNFVGKKARRSDSRYCSDECRKAEFTADDRFKETGSYMPVFKNINKLDDSANDKERKRVVAVDDEELQEIAHKRQGDYMKQVEEQLFDNHYQKKLNNRQKSLTISKGR